MKSGEDISRTAVAGGDKSAAPIRIGIGYRGAIHDWTIDHLADFDVLELTVDHYIYGGEARRTAICDMASRIPIVLHGVGLSIGTDVPLNWNYLEQVGLARQITGSPFYTEHLAFTRVPGRDLANLLPLPRTPEVAEKIIEKIRQIRSFLGCPFHIENIANLFEWPDSVMNDAEFIELICRESGAGLLLDVENTRINGMNFGFDPYEFLDSLPAGLVKAVHMAGGSVTRSRIDQSVIHADTHNRPVPDDTHALLAHALRRQMPETIILERDDRLYETDEIETDMARIRAMMQGAPVGQHSDQSDTARQTA